MRSDQVNAERQPHAPVPRSGFVLGLFSDGNPWFGNAAAFTTGNPLVQDPAIGADTGDRATWGEAWIEFGLGGVTQLGNSNVAVYGAATAIAVAARGQDIFRDDP